MALTPGSRLGGYEILSALGAGGVVEVYRAQDTRLKRDVALKILPDSFAGGPDRLARFEREAPTLERAHNRMATICLHIGRLEEMRLAVLSAGRIAPVRC